MPFAGAAAGALLLQDIGDGRPFEVIGVSGHEQASGVLYVLTHDFENPKHKTSLAELPENRRVVIGVSVAGPPGDRKAGVPCTRSSPRPRPPC